MGRRVCELLEDGLSLLETCRRLGIPYATVHNWAYLHPDFKEKYARAREIGDDIEFERLTELAMQEPPKAGKGMDTAWVNWKRLQIDTAKWMLARKRPKKYGEKVQQEISGPEGGPVAIKVEFVGGKKE